MIRNLKWPIGILFFCLSSINLAAGTIHAGTTQANEINYWKFVSPDEGQFFLLGPESQQYLEIHVNTILDNGKKGDTVRVNCNGRSYQVEPGGTQRCDGNFADVIYMYTPPECFRNGSQGTYIFKALPYI